MPAITLPDSSVRRFDAPVTGATVAEAIGPGLARAALAMQLDGKLVDLATPIEHDAKVVFVTRRDDAALELIRHDHFAGNWVKHDLVRVGAGLTDRVRARPFVMDLLDDVSQAPIVTQAEHNDRTRSVVDGQQEPP